MLKVWSRLSLLLIVVLLSLGSKREVFSSKVFSSEVPGSDLVSSSLASDHTAGSRAARAESAPASPAPQQASSGPSAPAGAATAVELDGSSDEVADPELTLALALRVPAPQARALLRAAELAGARRAVPEAPFKPPNR